MVEVFGSDRMLCPAVLDSGSAGQRTVSHDMGAQEKVLSVVLSEDKSPSACPEIVHHGHRFIGIVHKVAVAIAANHHHSVNIFICNHHVLGYLHSCHSGAASLLKVDGPGILGTNFLLDVNPGCSEGIFLPLFPHTQHQIDFRRINSSSLQGVQTCFDPHLLRTVTWSRNSLAVYPQLFPDCFFRPIAFGGLRNLLSRH